MQTQKINLAIVFAVALTGIVVSALVTGLLVAYQSVPNYGTVKAVNIGVFQDEACTQNVTFIDWGFVAPGTTSYFTVYIKNEGSTPVRLNMTTENWTPSSAKDYITLNWDCEGQILNATNVVQALLTLSVSTDVAIVDFAFDIVIIGTEHS